MLRISIWELKNTKEAIYFVTFGAPPGQQWTYLLLYIYIFKVLNITKNITTKKQIVGGKKEEKKHEALETWIPKYIYVFVYM